MKKCARCDLWMLCTFFPTFPMISDFDVRFQFRFQCANRANVNHFHTAHTYYYFIIAVFFIWIIVPHAQCTMSFIKWNQWMRMLTNSFIGTTQIFILNRAATEISSQIFEWMQHNSPFWHSYILQWDLIWKLSYNSLLRLLVFVHEFVLTYQSRF